MTVVEISSDSQFTELTTSVSSSTLVALYFHTPWAEPCVQMNAVFSSLSAVYPLHVFLSINADDFPDISESFDVSAVPYFVFLKNRTIYKELSGADPKELANTIQSLTTAADGSNPNTSGSEKPAAASVPATAPEEEVEESEEELNKRLSKLVNAASVMLFMKGTPAEPGCGFSRQMVAILREKQVRFGFFDILKDSSVRQGLKVYSDWPTFPQLYINGELQGGLDIIKDALEEDPDFFEQATAATTATAAS